MTQHTHNIADDLNKRSRQWQHSVCLKQIVIILVLLLTSVFSLVLAVNLQSYSYYFISAAIALMMISGVYLQLLYKSISSQLLDPLAAISAWAEKTNAGQLSTRITLPSLGDYSALSSDMNSLSDKIQSLSDDMQQEVERQTRRIAQKNHVLEVLYDVAASINISSDMEDLLIRFLSTLKDVLKAEAATVRLTNYDGQMRLIGNTELGDRKDDVELLLPVLHCMYGTSLQEGEYLGKDKILRCEIYPGQPYYNEPGMEMIAVPLQYRDKNLGVYNLFVKTPSLLDCEDVKELLVSIGRHLGIAIEKAYTEDESKRLSLYRERNLLSHELHDSLAQTLASLRFQVRNLFDSLNDEDIDSAYRETESIHNGLDEAYTELRELISHFRAPFDERGLISGIETVIQQFREQNKIILYFHNQWQDTRLSSVYEMQVLRIIQESLNNIKKHSKAHSVRILLNYDSDGNHAVLIEDDGIGISAPVLGGHPGEQIGLVIMKERAHRVGGTLTIESEHGEGTQILLTFSTQQQSLLAGETDPSNSDWI
ncbi:Nitrate/nitrite sensor protein [hydrothermal vent metagenome]|uniref:histidine kinase n=1 Tax=hydrothermal vent metagenome TaxID=652676 RepID=A0A3B0Z401_9ZZZZ